MELFAKLGGFHHTRRKENEGTWRENFVGKIKLFVGIPSGGSFRWEHSIAKDLMWKYLGEKYIIDTNISNSCYVHVNRNIIMDMASKKDIDYLLFIDSDMIWEPIHIEYLIAFNRKVVSALYISSKLDDKGQRFPVAYRYDENKKLEPMWDLPDGVFKCDAVGAGFLLLKKEVVDKMVELIPKIGYPFDFIHYEKMGTPKPSYTDLVGEDISFCYRLKKAGFDIWVDPTVCVGHLSNEMIWRKLKTDAI